MNAVSTVADPMILWLKLFLRWGQEPFSRWAKCPNH